jgi:hypothetical protein
MNEALALIFTCSYQDGVPAPRSHSECGRGSVSAGPARLASVLQKLIASRQLLEQA